MAQFGCETTALYTFSSAVNGIVGLTDFVHNRHLDAYFDRKYPLAVVFFHQAVASFFRSAFSIFNVIMTPKRVLLHNSFVVPALSALFISVLFVMCTVLTTHVDG